MTSAIPPLVPATDLDGLRLERRGKVRDVYAVDDRHLLLVSTDRVSAFDYVLEPAIPYKGAVLNAISAFFFRTLSAKTPAHFVTDRVEEMPEPARRHASRIAGRAALVRRARIIPFECVVRGHLAGSAVKEYERTGAVYGVRVGEGLKPGDRFAQPIFTPTTKAEKGHDEPVSLEGMARAIGAERARELERRSVELFVEASRLVLERGLVLVDTKLEWGLDADGRVTLCDEILTPDSSRYWAASEWRPGFQPEPLDKQVVRNWLLRESGWSQDGAPPPLIPAIVIETAHRYQRLHELLTGTKLGAPTRGAESGR